MNGWLCVFTCGRNCVMVTLNRMNKLKCSTDDFHFINVYSRTNLHVNISQKFNLSHLIFHRFCIIFFFCLRGNIFIFYLFIFIIHADSSIYLLPQFRYIFDGILKTTMSIKTHDNKLKIRIKNFLFYKY